MSAFKFINLAIVAIYAIGSGLWVNTGDNWYRNLNAPSWQPPDWIFGLIWPYNFTVLAIIGWSISNKLNLELNLTWTIIFSTSVICALTWAYQFYIPHHLKFAAISLICVALLTLLLVFLAFKTSLILGFALIPYQVWVALASGLSYNYYKLN